LAVTGTATFASGLSINGGPTLTASMGQTYSQVTTATATVGSATFSTLNTLVLLNAGPYYCTFRAFQTANNPCTFQISSPAGTPLSSSTLALPAAGLAYTDATLTATAGQTVIVEWNRPSGAATCSVGVHVFRCLNTVANN
jgi:hypothetical protein